MAANFIYYYFGQGVREVWQDLRLPIIPAIASLRRWDQKSAVHVLDVSDHETHWGEYPKLLNFTVHRRKDPLADFAAQKVKLDVPVYQRLLSKPIVVYEFIATRSENLWAVSDIDLFWLREPLPFLGDYSKSVCCGKNAGFWYFAKESRAAHDAIMMWNWLCSHALLDHFMADRVIKCTKAMALQEEACLNYLQQRFPRFFESMPRAENFPFRSIAYPGSDPVPYKNIHFHGLNFKHAKRLKALACIYVQELRELVSEVLGEERMREIYEDKLDLPSHSLRELDEMRMLEDGQ